MVFGVFVAHTAYPAAFALTGLLILTALLYADRDRGRRGISDVVSWNNSVFDPKSGQVLV